MPASKFREVLEVNLTGTFSMCQAASPFLKGAGAGGVINIASITGLVGTAPDVIDAAGYVASKGAIIALTKDLAVKWAEYGVTVNAIAPGFIRTRLSQLLLNERANTIVKFIPLSRFGEPEDVAGLASYLASPAAAYITGQVTAIDGGWTSC